MPEEPLWSTEILGRRKRESERGGVGEVEKGRKGERKSREDQEIGKGRGRDGEIGEGE